MDRSPETTITVALAQMAVFRGAEASPQTLQLFARRLVAERCQVDDVVAACAELEVEERNEGELAFPSLGTLLARVQARAWRRIEEQKRLQREEEHHRMLAERWNVPTAEALADREASRQRMQRFMADVRAKVGRVV